MKKKSRSLEIRILFLFVFLYFGFFKCYSGSFALGDLTYSAISNSVFDTIPKKSRMRIYQSWKVLFDGKQVNKWRGLNSDTFPISDWEIKNGTLSVKQHKKGGDIITKEKYTNFELVFDFKLTYAANSGIKYLVNKIRNNKTGKIRWNGPEYQIIDDYNNPDIEGDSGSTASLYLIYAPENKILHPAGQWNHGKIIVKNKHIEHWLNGVKVVSCIRGSKDFRKRVSRTKFRSYNHYGEVESGHIMLTDHGGDKVYFKDIKIRRLN